MNLKLQNYDDIICELCGIKMTKEELLFDLRKKLAETKNLKEILLAMILPIQIFSWSLTIANGEDLLFYIIMGASVVMAYLCIRLFNYRIFNLEIKIDFIESAEEIK
ncbi:MAG: hypothetical protein HDQ96_04715 [Lachnospiraceae bacterium]|nr:hypothetical protein [Lachnospiraceae bacterium]